MNVLKQFLKADIDPAWLLRIFTIIPVVLILLGGGAAVWIYFFALSLLPQTDTHVETPGLSAEVQVMRDGNGIPGIIGKTEEDVALVLGYVMAQDRLWQMDYLRRAGQGKLAEVFGPAYLERDYLMRSLSAACGNLVEREELGERERTWLHKFVTGINRYIATHTKKRPVEFSFLEYQPLPFTPEDVMSIVLGLAWESSYASRVDPLMTRILGHLGREKALQLFPTDPAAPEPLIVSDLIGWEPRGPLFSPAGGWRDHERFPGFRGGCAWAVGPQITRSGKPMTACSTYQVLSAPGFWYRARLVAGDLRLSGVFVPGVPVAMAGTNGQVSWGSISTPVDDADLYIERMDTDEAESFWRVDRPVKVRLSNEAFRIRDRSMVTRTMKFTDHGPLVSDVRNSKALSLRWTAAHGLGLVRSFYWLNRAPDGNGLKNSLTMLKTPCLEIVWADEKGNWGAQTAGLVPIRPRGSDGIVPMPAWTGVHDWVGFIPFADLPSSNNPSAGMAVVADGRPGGDGYPYFVSCYWSPDSRADRVRLLLEQGSPHFRESFQRILNDTVSPLAQSLCPVILKAIEREGTKSAQEEEARKILSVWDHDMKRDSAGAALFALTYRSFVKELLWTPLGEELFQGFTAFGPAVSRLVTKVFLSGQKAWICDRDPQSILTKGFREAVHQGTRLLGADPKHWQWGEIHRAEFRHPLTERSRFLEILYDVGPISYRGSEDTIDYSVSSPTYPYRVMEGVSLKHVTDMTDPPMVSSISPLGSSAHFFSTHYKDQTRAWLGGRSLGDPLAVSDIQKTRSSAILFKPSRQPAVTMK